MCFLFKQRLTSMMQFITGVYFRVQVPSPMHSTHTHVRSLIHSSSSISQCLGSAYPLWVPEVQTAWKVNKTPLVSHREHTTYTKGRQSSVSHLTDLLCFLYSCRVLCGVCLLLWCARSCQIRSVSVFLAWSRLQTTPPPHATACFPLPLTRSLLCAGTKPFFFTSIPPQ